jgi:hypothetical protein
MSVSADIREFVRQRAGFACEYCGVTETDTGSELTIDHFQPQSQRGKDTSDNLVYSCHRCNEYKADYWPGAPEALALWNPRSGPQSEHFTLLADGTLYATTAVGAFTLRRLRLNRPPLIALRLRRRQNADEERLLARLRDVTTILEHLTLQHAALIREQQELLQEQQRLLQALADREFPDDER